MATDEVVTTFPQMAGKRPFEAAAHKRQIRTRQGMMDYLDVKWRVAWFNSDHAADGSIITEIVSHDDQHARFKATVTVARGDAVQLFTGHGSETQQDFPDFFEKAETKAVGRALALAGYGTDMATDLDDGEPMDGRGAAKDERAARRMEPNERQRVDQQHERNTAPPQPRQPEPSRISAVRSHPANETAPLGPWQPPEDVQNTAHLVGILNQHYGWKIAPDAKLGSIVADLYEEYRRDPEDFIPFDTDREGKQTRFPSTVWRWVKERATPAQP